jgi:hypothetical protein
LLENEIRKALLSGAYVMNIVRHWVGSYIFKIKYEILKLLVTTYSNKTSQLSKPNNPLK